MFTCYNSKNNMWDYINFKILIHVLFKIIILHNLTILYNIEKLASQTIFGHVMSVTVPVEHEASFSRRRTASVTGEVFDASCLSGIVHRENAECNSANEALNHWLKVRLDMQRQTAMVRKNKQNYDDKGVKLIRFIFLYVITKNFVARSCLHLFVNTIESELVLRDN